MANPWASGAWGVGTLASGSWETQPSNAGLSWQEFAWGGGTWALGSWQSAWAETGEFSVTGQQASLLKYSKVSGEYSTYSLSGQAAILSISKSLVADNGSFNLSGQNANLTASQYRIISVNSTNEITDLATGIQINGSNLTGTTSAKIIYLEGAALAEGSWASGTWASGVWGGGLGSAPEQVLTNISVVSPSLITADMFDVTTSAIPYTDVNHQYNRLYISNGVSSHTASVQILPPSGYIVGTVQPANIVTTSGQSIFSGVPVNANTQVRLPTTIAGIPVNWETQGGNITGRLTLDTPIPSASPIQIPIWDDTLGWDVINVTVRDISDVNTNLVANVGSYSLSGQIALSNRTYNLTAQPNLTTLTGQDANLIKGWYIQPSNLLITNTLSSPFMSTTGMKINYVMGVGINVLQAGSLFNVHGVGFGNDNSLDIILIDFLGASVECSISQINNSYIQVLAPTNSSALSEPIRLYIGDYSRTNGVIDIVDGAPIATSSRNLLVEVEVISFSVNNLSISQVWETSSFTQKHNLSVDGLSILSSETNVVNQIGNVSTTNDDLVSTSLLSEPQLTQKHNLSVDGISLSTSLEIPSNLYNPYLTVDNLTLNNNIDSTTIIQSNLLNVNGLTLSTILANNSVTQKHNLSVDNLTLSQTLNESSINFIVGLSVDNLRCETIENNVTNIPIFSITPNSLSITNTLENVEAIPVFGSSISDINVSVSISEPDLTQSNNLNVNSLRLTFNINTPQLPQKHTLSVNDIKMNSSISNSRAKLNADPLKISYIKVYPVFSGEILINQ